MVARPSSVAAAVVGIALVVVLSAGAAPLARAGQPTVASATTHPGIFSGLVTIRPDGSLSTVSAPISITGNTYKLTAAMDGEIVDERNGSTLDGAGQTLTYAPGNGYAILLPDDASVTVENFVISGAFTSFQVNDSTGITLENSTVSGSGPAAFVQWSSDVNVSTITAASSEGIFLEHVAGGAAYRNTVPTSVGTGITVAFGSNVKILDNIARLASGLGIVVTLSQGIVIEGNDVSSNATLNATGMVVQYDSDVQISGNVADSTSVGIEVYYSTNASLTGDHFSLGWYAIEITGSSNVAIIGENATGIGLDGATVGGSTNVSFFNDDFSHAGNVGISATSDTALSIRGTTFNNDYYVGIDGSYLASAVLTGDTASNLVSTDPAFLFYESNHVSLVGCTADHDGAGVEMDETSVAAITNSTFANDSLGAGYGIFLDVAPDAWIASDNVSGDVVGVLSFGAQNSTFSQLVGNHALNDGIILEEQGNTELLDSSFNNSLGDGIVDALSAGVTMTGVWADHATYGGINLIEAVGARVVDSSARYDTFNGVVVDNSEGIVVADSNLSHSGNGTSVGQSANVTIVGNVFDQNPDSVRIGPASNVTIYHNDFVGDLGWAIVGTTASSFAWDAGYPVGGNYWSNYTGPDVMNGPLQNQPGADGIGDTPVTLNASNIDHYPLEAPWTTPTITFVGSGLPTGASWGVTVGATFYSSRASSLVVPDLDAAWGNESYSVAAPAGWSSSPASGTVPVRDASQTIDLTFARITYAVTFNETGLASGTSWSVSINGTSYPGTGTSIVANLPSGTYSFAIAGVAGYSAAHPTGTFAVTTGPLSESVTFSPVDYAVTFQPVGLPSGAVFHVTFAGIAGNPGSGPSTFQSTNGSRSYAVSAPSGYTATPSTGTVNVTGGPATVYVAFTKNGSGSTTSGTSVASTPSWVWALLGLIAVVAVIGWLLAAMGRRKPAPSPGASPPTGASGGAGGAAPMPAPASPPAGGPPAPWSEGPPPGAR